MPRGDLVLTSDTTMTKSGRDLLIDLSEIDLHACHAGREDIDRMIPHRHEMALLDEVVWFSEDQTAAVAVQDVNADAFWVRGHFPTRALMPGVLMVEAGAQLACYMWNARQDTPRLAAFLRIDECSFRRSAVPGDRLLIACREVKCGRRRFVSDVQGVIHRESGLDVAFEARVTGMAMEEMPG